MCRVVFLFFTRFLCLSVIRFTGYYFTFLQVVVVVSFFNPKFTTFPDKADSLTVSVLRYCIESRPFSCPFARTGEWSPTCRPTGA